MRTESIKLSLSDGEMSAYVAYPEKSQVGALIAIMEIWGVDNTMKSTHMSLLMRDIYVWFQSYFGD